MTRYHFPEFDGRIGQRLTRDYLRQFDGGRNGYGAIVTGQNLRDFDGGCRAILAGKNLREFDGVGGSDRRLSRNHGSEFDV